jgi:hypothetical protein
MSKKERKEWAKTQKEIADLKALTAGNQTGAANKSLR